MATNGTKAASPASNTTKEHTGRLLLYTAVALTILTCSLAFIAWGQDNSWQLFGISTYQLFPVFGLLAFSIMWSQYVIEGVKNYLDQPHAIDRYFSVTGWLVLFAILLHPGLLIAQRYHDGYGLPPGSYVTYVAPMQRWIVILGSVSLLMFLAFELKRFYRDKPWWQYILFLNDVAIVAIFYHGLRLGQDIGHHWFQIVWYLYGLVLVPVFAYRYVRKYQQRQARLSART
jgi:hypothetical protein